MRVVARFLHIERTAGKEKPAERISPPRRRDIGYGNRRGRQQKRLQQPSRSRQESLRSRAGLGLPTQGVSFPDCAIIRV
jgi:hypothetical protein